MLRVPFWPFNWARACPLQDGLSSLALMVDGFCLAVISLPVYSSPFPAPDFVFAKTITTGKL